MRKAICHQYDHRTSGETDQAACNAEVTFGRAPKNGAVSKLVYRERDIHILVLFICIFINVLFFISY